MSQFMQSRKLWVYGAGNLGRQVLLSFDLSQGGQFDILGFIDDQLPLGTEVLLGKKVLGNRDFLRRQPNPIHKDIGLVLAIGYQDLTARYHCFQQCRELNYIFPNLIAPTAHVSASAQLGIGNLLLPGSILDTEVTLGDANYIDIGCLISHNTRIGNNNFLCLGVSTAGAVQIGDHNFIGMDTSLSNGTKVGSYNFISAKGLITTPIGDYEKIMTFSERRHLKNLGRL